MSLILYHHPISTCSQKVRLMLAEKALAYESRVIDLSKAEHLTADYLAINPNGVVPTLVHDGQPIMDSSVICEYLDEVFGGPSLTPDNARGRAAMRAWMRYLEEVPTVAIRAPSYNRLFARRLTALPSDEREALADRMPIRKAFLRKMGPHGFPAQMIEDSLEQLDRCLTRVEAALAHDGPFLLGDQLTIADLVLLPTLIRMEDLGMSERWATCSRTSHWLSLLKARPSMGQAYAPGSRVTPLDGIAGPGAA